jgi:hypothetical protein
MAKLYQDERLIGEYSEDELVLLWDADELWCIPQLLVLVAAKEMHISVTKNATLRLAGPIE